MKIFFLVLILVVLVVFFVPLWPNKVKNGVVNVTTYQKILLKQGKLYMDKQVQDMGTEEVRVQIENEIKKHFPDLKRSDKQLRLKRLEKVAGTESVWFAQYDVEEGEDMSVEIKMNVSTGEVIYYQDNWS